MYSTNAYRTTFDDLTQRLLVLLSGEYLRSFIDEGVKDLRASIPTTKAFLIPGGSIACCF